LVQEPSPKPSPILSRNSGAPVANNELLEQLQEQNKRLTKVEETAESLSVYCSPKTLSVKKNTIEISLSPPFDQRVYKKDFVFGGLLWQLQLYPNGKTEKDKGFGSLFFKLISSHIKSPNEIYVRIEIASQVLNGSLQERFSSGAIFGYAKAFEMRKLRAKVDFKLKMSFPSPLSASDSRNSSFADKAKRQLYL